jgi:hypothetical protein
MKNEVLNYWNYVNSDVPVYVCTLRGLYELCHTGSCLVPYLVSLSTEVIEIDVMQCVGNFYDCTSNFNGIISCWNNCFIEKCTRIKCEKGICKVSEHWLCRW